MSLKSEVKVLLKSADQFSLWKARVGAAIWAATNKDVFAVGEDEKDPENKWMGKAWMILTSSLDDELFMKLAHVPQGNIPAMLRNSERPHDELGRRRADSQVRDLWGNDVEHGQRSASLRC
jgi:hypothetical protein